MVEFVYGSCEFSRVAVKVRLSFAWIFKCVCPERPRSQFYHFKTQFSQIDQIEFQYKIRKQLIFSYLSNSGINGICIAIP